MQAEDQALRSRNASARPLSELLACPEATGNLLNRSARSMHFQAGEAVFRQMGLCSGLYVVVAGRFMRRAERLGNCLTRGAVRAGELGELAAALGNPMHTYTLMAQTAGAVMMLPIEVLEQAFASYPPLRMQLLGELAREVSRAYSLCGVERLLPVRRRAAGTAQA